MSKNIELILDELVALASSKRLYTCFICQEQITEKQIQWMGQLPCCASCKQREESDND